MPMRFTRLVVGNNCIRKVREYWGREESLLCLDDIIIIIISDDFYNVFRCEIFSVKCFVLGGSYLLLGSIMGGL